MGASCDMRCDRIPPSRLMYETASVLSVRTSTCLPNSSGRNCCKAKFTAHSSRQLMSQSSRGPVQSPEAACPLHVAPQPMLEASVVPTVCRDTCSRGTPARRTAHDFVDFLDDLGPGWNAGGAALLREARRAGQGIDSAWTQEGAHGDGQTEARPRGQQWMVHHPEASVLDRLGLLLHRRELLGKALDGVAEQPCLGDGGVKKVCLVDILHLYQVEPEMALLDHHGGHRLPEGPRRDFRRS